MPALSASVSMMFRELPVLDRFGAARAAGFAGVEIQNLAEADPAAMARAARDAGVTVALINVGMGDLATGGPGLSGVPGREAAFRAAFAEALEAARLLGAGRIHLGPSRVPAEVTREDCLAAYRANVATALTMAANHPVRLMIEPLNRVDHPAILLSDLAEAAALVADLGPDRLAVQFDIYHAAMNGQDPVAAWRQVSPWVGHVQFADAPGRHEPGTGTTDFPAIFRAIAAGDYDGWVGAEYVPAATTAASFGWLDTLGALLHR